MNALADEEIELTDSQVRRHQVLLFVEVSNAGLRCFLDDDLKRECALESGQPKNDAMEATWQRTTFGRQRRKFRLPTNRCTLCCLFLFTRRKVASTTARNVLVDVIII